MNPRVELGPGGWIPAAALCMSLGLFTGVSVAQETEPAPPSEPGEPTTWPEDEEDFVEELAESGGTEVPPADDEDGEAPPPGAETPEPAEEDGEAEEPAVEVEATEETGGDETTQETEAPPVPTPGLEALSEGLRLREAGRWRPAANAFAEALRLLPEGPARHEALEGMREAITMLDRGPMLQGGGGVGLQGLEQRYNEQKQRTKVEFAEAERRAKELLAKENYAGANQAILTGKIRLIDRRQYLTESEFADLMSRTDGLIADIAVRREHAEALRGKREMEEVTTDQRDSERRTSQERRRRIEEYLRKILQFEQELKYDEALAEVDQILFLDEHNPAALALRNVLTNAKMQRDYAEIQRRKEYGFTWHNLEAQDALVPPIVNTAGPGDRSLNGIMTWPEDWPGLTNRRLGLGGFVASSADRAVQQRMAEVTNPGGWNFQANQFAQVVDYMSNVSGMDIYVDWKSLDYAGVQPTDRVTVQLGDVPFDVALDRVLDQLGDGLSQPRWAVQDGILTISSEDALRKNTLLRIYDITDLLFTVEDYGNAPIIDGGGAAGGLGSSRATSDGGVGGGGIFSAPRADPRKADRQALTDRIIGIIQDNVDPMGWAAMGGDTGHIDELNGNLIITNTPSSHVSIGDLLGQLREIRALQINVEARFLEVRTNWFEQIGVDIDLYFNLHNELFELARAADPNANLGDFFVPGTAILQDPLVYGGPTDFTDDDGDGIPDAPFPINTPGTGNWFASDVDGDGSVDWTLLGDYGSPIRNTQGWSPLGAVQDSSGLIEVLAGASTFGKTIIGANPAIGLGVQFLDDIQVDLLIEATQADRRSVSVAAPRLTFHNGQQAWIALGSVRQIVTGLDAPTGQSGAFTPVIGQALDGIVLWLHGVISADRRYVTLDVRVTQQETTASDERTFSGAVSGTGQGGESGQFEGVIDLLTQTQNTLRTAVTVPDKGTVLLGGQKRVDEFETEVGVPVLSKLPWVNRFFTNRITDKEERTLLILLRPEIIIQSENERMLFTDSIGDAFGGASSFR